VVIRHREAQRLDDLDPRAPGSRPELIIQRRQWQFSPRSQLKIGGIVGTQTGASRRFDQDADARKRINFHRLREGPKIGAYHRSAITGNAPAPFGDNDSVGYFTTPKIGNDAPLTG